MEFRDYLPDDFEAMFRLDEACFEPPFRFSRAMMRRFAETKKARVVIAEENGLAGFCIVHVERVEGGRVGYILTLDVDAAWRGKGLAGELMRRAETEARDAGCAAMALHVYGGNDRAIRFYERVGYQRWTKVARFYGKAGDAWVYRKVIGPKSCQASQSVQNHQTPHEHRKN
jgi:ribosomal-protein-alanine N-acetyltransferase